MIEILIFLCAFCFSAEPQPDSKEVDISVVNLSIEKVQHVRGPIKGTLVPLGEGSFGGGVQFTIVTMRGVAPKPLKFDIGARSFIATYQKSSPGRGSNPLQAVESSGILLKSKPEDKDNWILDWPNHPFDNLSFEAGKPGPLIIKAAFVIPNNVATFDVTYRSSRGKKTLIGRAVASDASH